MEAAKTSLMEVRLGRVKGEMQALPTYVPESQERPSRRSLKVDRIGQVQVGNGVGESPRQQERMAGKCHTGGRGDRRLGRGVRQSHL